MNYLMIDMIYLIYSIVLIVVVVFDYGCCALKIIDAQIVDLHLGVDILFYFNYVVVLIIIAHVFIRLLVGYFYYLYL